MSSCVFKIVLFKIKSLAEELSTGIHLHRLSAGGCNKRLSRFQNEEHKSGCRHGNTRLGQSRERSANLEISKVSSSSAPMHLLAGFFFHTISCVTARCVETS